MATQNKEYVLVKLEANYADEFDVESFVVVSTEYFENAKVMIRAMAEESGLHMGFGTNESLEWCDFEDFENALTVTPLTAAQVAFFEQFFPPSQRFKGEGIVAEYGHSGFLNNIASGSPY